MNWTCAARIKEWAVKEGKKKVRESKGGEGKGCARRQDGSNDKEESIEALNLPVYILFQYCSKQIPEKSSKYLKFKCSHTFREPFYKEIVKIDVK